MKRALERVVDQPAGPRNHGAEIDLVIDRPGQSRVFVEVKSGETVDETDVKTLTSFHATAKRPTSALLLSRCPVAKRIGSVGCLPWQRGIEEIGL